MEAQGAYIIPMMLQALDAVKYRDYSVITTALEELTICIGRIGEILGRMDEKCDPMVFYHQIRPFLAGSKNMGAAGLPNGVSFSNGDGEFHWKQLRGGSNGQSSLIQFLDIVLGVEHKSSGGGVSTSPGSGSSSTSATGAMTFHEEVRLYMPAPHREFLGYVSRMDSLKELAREPGDSEEQRQFQRAFHAATKALGDFRNRHIHIVTRYIIIPSRRPSHLTTTNLATVSSQSNQRQEGELTGTGGTALIPFLRQTRDETYLAGMVDRD
ncbi:Indoleamine 2,3-dioxygenase [Hypoxylon fragiforme]|uniref:Indoleamine 2,3-dioxygenase n=1 Tax=Hypoxylon fragiforme TaxID=63214 RepID=UPI0020C63D36|nr:Indoleamine 2,3-dioxygenase [Hypoxylon fragiforme]KAI2604712.1 Indoleamine 2,3-dioxygenase [Hypoxylon fragiforme]